MLNELYFCSFFVLKALITFPYFMETFLNITVRACSKVLPSNKVHLKTAGKCVHFKDAFDTAYF